jgi:DNA-binding response OmpR family regulator
MVNNKKKILLIEDDQAISIMYKGKLESDGFSVLTAVNGADGLELAKKEGPDLIMLDIILPQLDGFSVLAELKKDSKTKGIPVIMLTNLGTDEDRAKGEKMGAVDYFVKANMTPAQISEKIKKYLT